MTKAGSAEHYDRHETHPAHKEHHIDMAERKASATVVVNGRPKFPIPDKAHAKAALARINQAKPPLTPSQKEKVEAKAHRVLGE